MGAIMIKATLNLNETSYKNYNIQELHSNWRKYPVIKMWLKLRRFDLANPIFVDSDLDFNTLTFSQSNSNLSRNIVLVHPNPDILKQLTDSLVKAGHQVTSFKKVQDANWELGSGQPIDSIIIPENLKVSTGCTYKNYLNHKFPNLKVLTVDKRNYRETLNLKEI